MKRVKEIKLLKGSYEFNRSVGKTLYKQVVDFCRAIGGTLRFYGKHFATGDELLMIEAPPETKRIICYNKELGEYLSGVVHTTYLYYVFETNFALSKSRGNWKRMKLFCSRTPLRSIRNRLYHVPLPNILADGRVCFDGVVGDHSIAGRYRSFWGSAFTLYFFNCYKDLDVEMIPENVFDRELLPIRKACFSLNEYAYVETKSEDKEDKSETDTDTNDTTTNNNTSDNTTNNTNNNTEDMT